MPLTPRERQAYDVFMIALVFLCAFQVGLCAAACSDSVIKGLGVFVGHCFIDAFAILVIEEFVYSRYNVDLNVRRWP